MNIYAASLTVKSMYMPAPRDILQYVLHSRRKLCIKRHEYYPYPSFSLSRI